MKFLTEGIGVNFISGCYPVIGILGAMRLELITVLKVGTDYRHRNGGGKGIGNMFTKWVTPMMMDGNTLLTSLRMYTCTLFAF